MNEGGREDEDEEDEDQDDDDDDEDMEGEKKGEENVDEVLLLPRHVIW